MISLDLATLKPLGPDSVLVTFTIPSHHQQPSQLRPASEPQICSEIPNFPDSSSQELLLTLVRMRCFRRQNPFTIKITVLTEQFRNMFVV